MSCDTSLSNRESKKLAKKLKHEDPEQFQTLVRMHLSFVLDLTMDESDVPPEKAKFRPLKWGLGPFSKKLRGPEKEIADSVPLTSEVVKQIDHLVEFLVNEENISQEGIFRRSGKVTRQQQLKSLLQEGSKPSLEDGKFSVHDVASVLKAFLAELPEPLLTEVYYPIYCHIADLCLGEQGKTRVLRALQLLFLLLPFENRRILKTILKLLHLTASHVGTNRMTAQNLATLFTPHLLCPRKLSPEVFHTTAQTLSCIVVFIINESNHVFDVPQALATDIKAYWERRRLTPNHFLERSMSETTTANTVFSFLDRERTERENVVNPTETALAQLYAHIQGLPESNKKKRLIKQFNKENGQGTPRTKTLGDSIKKHIFCKNVKSKALIEYNQLKCDGSSGDELPSPDKKTPKSYKMKTDKMVAEGRIKACGRGGGVKRRSDGEGEGEGGSPPKQAREEMGGKLGGGVWWSPGAVTSTPGPFHTPSPLQLHTTEDMSPITRSAQRMPKAMQEAMVTPRSRKPVVALSGSNLCQLGSSQWPITKDISWGNNQTKEAAKPQRTAKEEPEEDAVVEEESLNSECLTSEFRDYLFSRSVLTTSPADLSFSSQPGDFDQSSSDTDHHQPPPPPLPPLSESLLYFLDGGESPPTTDPSSRVPSGSHPTPPSHHLQPRRPTVTETSL